MENKLDIIPIKVGAKAFTSSNLYFGAEVGAGFEVDNGAGGTSLILSPAFGYASKRWDLGARYENFSAHGNSLGVIAMGLAYAFEL